MDPLVEGRAEQTTREMPELERALLRRGVDQRAARRESCSGCGRTPLVGERVYVADRGAAPLVLCELCRRLELELPLRSRPVRGPAFGNTLRVLDQRAA